MDTLAELERLIEGLSPKDLAEFDKLAAEELALKWRPSPGPQTDAYLSEADMLLYGGAAGGGKTDLLVGLSLTAHQRVVIFRRSYGELSDIAERFLEVNGSRQGFNGQDMRFRTNDLLVEFGALEKPGSERAWRGRAHDLICFDEGGELSKGKIAFVIGWLRSTDSNQRCRVVIASNPPTGGEGAWMIEWFAPWLDPLFPHPAKPGELRWAILVGDETRWVEDATPVEIDGETYTPRTRTFIPALLGDNPYLRDTDYRATLQNMPEPLRSQLLNGDFLAGREDHAWQVIPSSWVVAANRRWEEAEQKRRTMIALSADVALGGGDDTVLAALHSEVWFAPLITRKEPQFSDRSTAPAEIATLMLMTRRDNADLSVDGTGGWGSGVASHLVKDHDVECYSIVYSKGSNARTRNGKLGFKNLRDQMYWQFREALDPETGDEIKLAPDQRLLAELTALRYGVRGTDIKVEEKEDVAKRVGSSPDRADATVQAWHRRAASVRKATKRKPVVHGGGWMAR